MTGAKYHPSDGEYYEYNRFGGILKECRSFAQFPTRQKPPGQKVNSCQIHSPWLGGEKLTPCIGLSYRPDRLDRLAGLYDNPKYDEVNYIPPVRDYEFGYRTNISLSKNMEMDILRLLLIVLLRFTKKLLLFTDTV